MLEGITQVAGASLEVAPGRSDTNTSATVRLVLESPVPPMAAQALAGKAIRRLKALVETGEVPTTEHNPSARTASGGER